VLRAKKSCLARVRLEHAVRIAVRWTRYAIEKRIIPTFKWRSLVAARKSKIRRKIAELEAAAEDRQ